MKDNEKNKREAEVDSNALLAQKILLSKLRVKKATKILESMVKENFGYAPRSDFFDYTLRTRCLDLEYLRNEEPEWVDCFYKFDDKEKGSETPTYLS